MCGVCACVLETRLVRPHGETCDVEGIPGVRFAGYEGWSCMKRLCGVKVVRHWGC